MELLDHFVKKGFEKISNGCYGVVYGSHASEWVVKYAANDGTRTYLEWCLLMQRKGRKMRGMPELDFVVGLGKHYMVAMKRYKPIKGRLMEFGWDSEYESYLHEKDGCPEYLKKLIEAFEKDCPAITCNDVHYENVMTDGKSVILTDPSSSGYRPTGCTVAAWYTDEREEPPFELVG